MLDQVADVGGGGLVQAPVPPVFDDPVPVGAIDAAGAVGDRGGHDRDVVGERRGGVPRVGVVSRSSTARPIRDSSRRAASMSAVVVPAVVERGELIGEHHHDVE